MAYSPEPEKPPEEGLGPFTGEMKSIQCLPLSPPYLVRRGGSGLSLLPCPRRVKGNGQHPYSASSPTQEAQSMESSRRSWYTGSHPPPRTPGKASLARLPDLRPLAVMLHGARRNCKHPRGRIPTINVAAKYCKTPNSPICVLPPKRENSLHRHSLIWQANSKPYWQSQACFPNQTAMEPKIALPVIC